jgi:hypothetical protein
MWPQVLIFWDGWSTGVYRCLLDLCGLRWGGFFWTGYPGRRIIIHSPCMLSLDQIQIRAERNGAHVIPRKRRNMLCTASQANSFGAERSELAKRVACADRIFLPELRCGRARVGGYLQTLSIHPSVSSTSRICFDMRCGCSPTFQST